MFNLILKNNTNGYFSLTKHDYSNILLNPREAIIVKEVGDSVVSYYNQFQRLGLSVEKHPIEGKDPNVFEEIEQEVDYYDELPKEETDENTQETSDNDIAELESKIKEDEAVDIPTKEALRAKYDEMSKKDLLDLIKASNIDFKYTDTKAELIEKLVEA